MHAGNVGVINKYVTWTNEQQKLSLLHLNLQYLLVFPTLICKGGVGCCGHSYINKCPYKSAWEKKKSFQESPLHLWTTRLHTLFQDSPLSEQVF